MEKLDEWWGEGKVLFISSCTRTIFCCIALLIFSLYLQKISFTKLGSLGEYAMCTLATATFSFKHHSKAAKQRIMK
jgi:hypothetical protein